MFIPFSIIYYIGIFLRNFFYKAHIFRQYSVCAKVISVGNITWGGTGKTPLVASIAGTLLKKGKKVAILIRGYGKDEPELFSKLVPGVRVLVGKDRVKNAQEAISKHGVDTILLDDGFQHRSLKRDMDIVCIDAMNPFGNGWVIPVGCMREGLGSLRRADVFLITKVDLVEQDRVKDLEDRLRSINPDALIVRTVHKPEQFEGLQNKEVVLASGIGSPVSFEKTVLKLGIKIKKHFIFRDHHWYNEKDLKNIEDYCRKKGIDTVIVTEKDAVRLGDAREETGSLRNLFPTQARDRRVTNICVLRIKLEITSNGQAFDNRLFGVCNS